MQRFLQICSHIKNRVNEKDFMGFVGGIVFYAVMREGSEF
jgi:hypothetical protein